MVGGGFAAALLACQMASKAVNAISEVDHSNDHWHPSPDGIESAMPYRCESATCSFVDTKIDLYM